MREPGEEADRAVEHPVEVGFAFDELDDRAALGGAERFEFVDAVDEHAVAEVGGDAPRRGVRLGDVSLGLELGHVVADRRGRHPEGVPRTIAFDPTGSFVATKSSTIARSTCARLLSFIRLLRNLALE